MALEPEQSRAVLGQGGTAARAGLCVSGSSPRGSLLLPGSSVLRARRCRGGRRQQGTAAQLPCQPHGRQDGDAAPRTAAASVRDPWAPSLGAWMPLSSAQGWGTSAPAFGRGVRRFPLLSLLVARWSRGKAPRPSAHGPVLQLCLNSRLCRNPGCPCAPRPCSPSAAPAHRRGPRRVPLVLLIRAGQRAGPALGSTRGVCTGGCAAAHRAVVCLCDRFVPSPGLLGLGVPQPRAPAPRSPAPLHCRVPSLVLRLLTPRPPLQLGGGSALIGTDKPVSARHHSGERCHIRGWLLSLPGSRWGLPPGFTASGDGERHRWDMGHGEWGQDRARGQRPAPASGSPAGRAQSCPPAFRPGDVTPWCPQALLCVRAGDSGPSTCCPR